MAEHSIIEGISLSENCSSESEGETSRGRKVLQLVESVITDDNRQLTLYDRRVYMTLYVIIVIQLNFLYTDTCIHK